MSKNRNFKVYLTSSFDQLRSAPDDSIIIYPTVNKPSRMKDLVHWGIFIRVDKLEYSTSNFHFGFLNKKSNSEDITHDVLNKVVLGKVTGAKKPLIETTELGLFFSMFPQMQNYREIISVFGKALAKDILISLHDLVAIKRQRPQKKWYRFAIESTNFLYSFIREPEAYYTFYNAGTILDGLPQEKIGDISKNFHLKFQLPTYTNPHELKFSFNSKDDLSKRIAVLIGRNGAGKSQTLNHIVKYATSNDKKLFDDVSGRLRIGRIIAFSSPGETTNTFPSEKKDGSLFYKRLSIGRSKARKKDHALGEIILRLLRHPQFIAGKGRWGIFKESVSKVVPFEQLALRITTNSENPTHDYFLLDHFQHFSDEALLQKLSLIKKTVDPVLLTTDRAVPLSSGQITFLCFAAQLCLYIENGSLILMDEPETHLHPNFIPQFVETLDSQLKQTGSIAILATHSVYFVREVPASQVQILKARDRHIEIIEPRLKTIGCQIGAISHFIFDDEPFGGIVEKLYEHLSSNLSSARKKLDDLRDELPSEAIMHLERKLGLGN